MNNDAFPVKDADPNLQYAHLIQNIDKDSNTQIDPSDFNAMMELDIATAQAL